ncbi:Cthe_2314 family HEPN domain-containing protein [Cohnella sp. GCM10012308]|uniref:Cthe_2314 family HEPN domain-containing protein n=1 Tax=Cohnella sp. GCM10012308 TaxID=3317329 RepID=UPI003609DA68
MREHEIEYLKSQLFDIDFDKYEFGMQFGDNKVVMGIMGDNEYSIIFEYKALTITFLNLCKKINYSLEKAIELIYNTDVYDSFSMFKSGSEDEFKAYYYIENGIFRIATLWDILAQIYNLLYQCDLDNNKIHYYRFFEKLSKSENSIAKVTAQSLIDYFNETPDGNYEGNTRWIGNHKEVNNYRNKMTHRNSPDETVLSNFDLNLKTHPSLLLKRVLEDYKQATIWLDEVIIEVINSVLND